MKPLCVCHLHPMCPNFSEIRFLRLQLNHGIYFHSADTKSDEQKCPHALL